MEIEELIGKVKEIIEVRRETARLAGENLAIMFGWDLNHAIKSYCDNPLEEKALYIAHHHVDSAEYVANPSKELFWNSRARHLNLVSDDRYLCDESRRLVDGLRSDRICYEDPQVTEFMKEKADCEMGLLREAMGKVDPVKMQETVDDAIKKYAWQLDAVKRFQEFDGPWESFAKTLE